MTNPSTLLPWSSPVQVQTLNGPRLVRKASATPDFWKVWSTAKVVLKDHGISLSKEHGQWTVCWWTALDGSTQPYGAAPVPAPAEPEPDCAPPSEPRWHLNGFDLAAQFPSGRTLMGHQKETLSLMLQHSLIVADEMGCGKTMAALVAARIIYEQSQIVTVVVCPANLINNWREEAALVGFKNLSVYSWAKLPSETMMENHDYILIGDECHKASAGMKSKRGAGFLRLASCAEAVYCLSGTPMNNAKPINIFPLMKAVGHPLAKNQKKFEERFCGAELVERPFKRPSRSCPGCHGTGKLNGRTCRCRMVRFWDNGGSTNVDALHEALKPWMIRHLKSECLDLPPKTRVMQDVEVSDEMQASYDTVLRDAKARYSAKLLSGEVASWKDDEGALRGNGEALTLLMGIRQAASIAKVEASIELIDEIIAQGSKVVVFGEFKASVLALARHYKVLAYTGDVTSRTEKDDLVRHFQSDSLDSPKVFPGTIAAGGTGLTLTAASYVLLHDRPLVPGDAAQAEDRTHRKGQRWAVTSLWVRAFDICRTIDELLVQKERIIERTLAGEQGGSGSVTAQQVLKKLFCK